MTASPLKDWQSYSEQHEWLNLMAVGQRVGGFWFGRVVTSTVNIF